MGKAAYFLTDQELALSCGGAWGYSQRIPPMPCIGHKTLKVDVGDDGNWFVGDVRIRFDGYGNLDREFRLQAQLCNHARLHGCKVCDSRFIGHLAAFYCSPECRKVVAKKSLARYRENRKRIRELSPESWDFTCHHCGQHSRGKRRTGKYCSAACKQAAYRSRKSA